jgi:SH3-like domain-containing protein
MFRARAIALGMCMMLLTLVAFGIAGCGDTSSQAPAETGTLIGVVYDSQSTAVLGGVKVSYGADLFTTSSGRGVFELAALPYGSLEISFIKQGYKASTRTVDLKEPKMFLEILLDSDQSLANTLVDEVKLRKDPNLNGEILEVLAQETKLVLTGEINKGWYGVQAGAKSGWVWGGYLRSTDAKIPRMEILADGKLYKEANSAEEIEDIFAGIPVIVTGTSSSWTKILLPSGTEGWLETTGLTG